MNLRGSWLAFCGCDGRRRVGETVAAIEASAALQTARDPAVREVLGAIAREELRHAELAWRALAWLVKTGRADRDTIERELAAAERDALGAGGSSEASEVGHLPEHGVIGAAERRSLRSAAFDAVIRGCARQVLGAGAAAPAERASAAALPRV